VDRAKVADALEEIGLLLELLGENPFKTRAYANGARILRGLDRDLGELIRTKELGTIKGFGEALVEKVTVLHETGSLPYLEKLRREVPPGLLAWLDIPGLGPKKARTIHVALGIETLDELEEAARAGKIRVLEGFGETSEKRILEGIARVRSHAGRFLMPVARAEADRLVALLRGVRGVHRVEAAGSVRRRAETSKDIDLVVVAEDAETAMDAFVSAGGVVEVTGRGETKCSLRLASGLSSDLRVVPERSFPFALCYFTGSKAHNVALRSRAQKRGLKLNEYALVREANGEEIPCADEEGIYRELGLGFIPPELREDRGEIEAAEEGRLPVLLEDGDLRGVLHCHSTWSDGQDSVARMADAARERGMDYLGLTDHSRSATYARGLTIDRVREQHAEIDAWNAKERGGFRILKGIECDILAEGALDYPDEVLASFDFVIASVHSRFHRSEQEQTARIVRALRNPWVDILGHPTGRLLLERDPYPVDLFRVLDAAIEEGVAVEINAHPMRLDLDTAALRYGIPKGMKTSIDPDAHETAGLDDVRWGVGVARRGWCTADDVLNAWPLERLLRWFEERKRRARRRGAKA
jgi:DNA polymerase (family 10)